MAVLCSTDSRLGLEDLRVGDNEELLLLCLLYRLPVGDRLLRRRGVVEGLVRPLGEIERLFRLYHTHFISNEPQQLNSYQE